MAGSSFSLAEVPLRVGGLVVWFVGVVAVPLAAFDLGLGRMV